MRSKLFWQKERERGREKERERERERERDHRKTATVLNSSFLRQVAWIKSDTKAILAIHNAVITHFNRLAVAHSDHNTWTLTLRDVRQSDSGPYMCQVNTDPMRYQVSRATCAVSKPVNQL